METTLKILDVKINEEVMLAINIENCQENLEGFEKLSETTYVKYYPATKEGVQEINSEMPKIIRNNWKFAGMFLTPGTIAKIQN